MKTFIQFITEMSAKPFPYTVEMNERRSIHARFDTGSDSIKIEAELSADYWEISFASSSSAYELSSNKSTKEALQTYATVIDFVRKEIKPHIRTGGGIMVDPYNSRTIKIYLRFCKAFAHEINGTISIDSGRRFRQGCILVTKEK